MQTATLFHRGEDGGFERMVFPKTKIYGRRCAKVIDGGLEKSDGFIVRIFYKKDLPIKRGDKLCIGDVLTPIADSLTILKISDNRVGLNAHWRLDCV